MERASDSIYRTSDDPGNAEEISVDDFEGLTVTDHDQRAKRVATAKDNVVTQQNASICTSINGNTINGNIGTAENAINPGGISTHTNTTECSPCTKVAAPQKTPT
jgi:hypothetical protein